MENKKSEKMEKLSFKKLNYISAIPEDFKDYFLELDSSVSDELYRQLKDGFLNLNCDDEKRHDYLETLVSFINKNLLEYDNFQKIDFSKIDYNNLRNFTSLSKNCYFKINNFDTLYEISYNVNTVLPHLSLLSKIGNKDISNIIEAVFDISDHYHIKQKLELLNHLLDEGFDISILNKLGKTKINEVLNFRNDIIKKIDNRFIDSIPNKYPEFTILAIEKNIDYNYILKHNPSLIYEYESLLKTNIQIDDFYKNGYSDDTLKGIIMLRKSNLDLYEAELVDFFENKENDAKLKEYFFDFLTTDPTKKTLELFKEYIKNNDIYDVKSIVTIFKKVKNNFFKHPEVIFNLNENIRPVRDFYENFGTDYDLTQFDIEDKSYEFLDKISEAIYQDYTLEEIFDKDVLKHEDYLLESLSLKRAGILLPEDEEDLLNLYFNKSNEEYEMLLRVYHKAINGVHFNYDFIEKLEYLLEYNKKNPPVLIDNFINKKLEKIKEILEERKER